MSIVDVALLMLGTSVGLTFAAHGAQKTFGWWGGPGIAGWRGTMATMGFRPPALFAFLSTTAELVGGLGLAVGVLTSFAAALLVAQSIVIIFHVHWEGGFWNTHKGFEYPLQLAVAAAAVGLVGRGLLSVDGALGMPGLLGLGGLLGPGQVVDVTPPLSIRIGLLLAGAIAGSVTLAVPGLAAGRRAAATERS